jgi:DNA modification methylase
MQAQTTVQNQFINTITQGDCIQVMRHMPANSAAFILTDPPYLVNCRDRDGRTHPERRESRLAQACNPRSVSRTEAQSRSRHVLRLDEG